MEETVNCEESDCPKTNAKGRTLRQKEKKFYTDEGIDDDEIEGRRTFSLDDKIRDAMSPGPKFYIEMKGSDVNLKYFQKNGFVTPILVKDKSGLGLRMPSENFTVSDVKRCVGSFRTLDVVDVTTQKDLEMTVKEWVRYYESPDRERLLNVISLEFSHTKLETYVDQPEVIHQMDWVDLAWPWFLKEYQTESTNVLDRMMYPKVQKYCLMSVKGCYTDFHIDMGGTSVWYHILKGKKVFWLIPPSEENLQAYENWTLSAKQGDVFFGDTVTVCYPIILEAGWTFFIPTGWIHAVYTPEDSLVFGGNFLHSFGIEMQLRIWEVENKTHVPAKFRYPLFCEIHWYVLERYVSCLTGKQHRTKSKEEICVENGTSYEIALEGSEIEQQAVVKGEVTTERINCKGVYRVRMENDADDGVNLSMICDGGATDEDKEEEIKQEEEEHYKNKIDSLTRSGSDSTRNIFEAMLNIGTVEQKEENLEKRLRKGDIGRSQKEWVNMTVYERDGLAAVICWLDKLPPNKKCIPKDIPDPLGLLSDAKALLKSHLKDNHEKAINGQAMLTWPVRKKPRQKRTMKSPSGGSTNRSQSGAGMWRYRRVRCRACEPCTRSDCADCVYCRDMKKFGGPGRKKQTCISRQCLAPILPNNAVCEICNQGDSGAGSLSALTQDGDSGEKNLIMECRICFEITHPHCLKQQNPEIIHQGVIDEDLPSSWECARCCQEGKEGQGKQRHKLFTLPHESHRRRQRRQSSCSQSSVESLSSPGTAAAATVVNKKVERDERTFDSVKLEASCVVATTLRKNKRKTEEENPAVSGKKKLQLSKVKCQAAEDGLATGLNSQSRLIQGNQKKLKMHQTTKEEYSKDNTTLMSSNDPDEPLQENFPVSKTTTHGILSKKVVHKTEERESQGKNRGRGKRKQLPGEASKISLVPEAVTAQFSLPMRINSHGREITTPRRYLV